MPVLWGIFDSPVIYGVRVETSNPYHLLYIESAIKLFLPRGKTFENEYRLSAGDKKVKYAFLPILTRFHW